MSMAGTTFWDRSRPWNDVKRISSLDSARDGEPVEP
jgi:hypothetical protein